ncbi:putative membrane-anchored protein [Rhizobium leguminosarum]|nr:putative membrane-anchored protein [Rhizobium leguminosarum]
MLEKLDFQQGVIKLPDAKATLNVPADFYYLSPADAMTVLVDIWGNRRTAAEGTMGMIFPAKYAPTDIEAWGSTVEYSADGYVSDADAATTNYDELLQNIKDSIRENNVEREKQGFPKITLVGWASAPHYDTSAHAMHWARDLMFGDDTKPQHTLNYSVRVLGREGVFQFNFIAGLDQLKEIEGVIPTVTKLVQFDKGKAYTDYVEGDKIAAYGMAGMIAAGAGAKIAAKVGLLAIALAVFKKAGILVVVVAGAVLRFAKGLFNRDKTPTA